MIKSFFTSIAFIFISTASAQDIKIGRGYEVSQIAGLSPTENTYKSFLEQPYYYKSEIEEVAIKTEVGDVHLFYPNTSYFLMQNVQPLVKQSFSLFALAINKHHLAQYIQDLSWNIVILKKLPNNAKDTLLSDEYLHSAWVAVPADIVISLSRFNDFELKSQQAFSQRFLEVLIHEISHVLEWRLMGKAFSKRQRWHGEGFSMLFEEMVLSLDSEEKAISIRQKRIKKANEVFKQGWSGNLFQGTADDYLRSYAMILAIAKTKTFESLISIYHRMISEQCSFIKAVQLELDWDEDKWTSAAATYLEVSKELSNTSAISNL